MPSHDVAGFIGNGHFMRDALHGIAEVERLAPELGFAEAVYVVNKVSQDFLIRPMGIFQLIDYVGIDVCQFILKVMADRMPGTEAPQPAPRRLCRRRGRAAASSPTARRRTAFLRYEKGRPAAVYDPAKKAYVPFAEIAARVRREARAAARRGQALEERSSAIRTRANYLEGYLRRT